MEQSYLIFFVILFVFTVGTATLIFYNFSYQASAPIRDSSVKQSDVFNETVVFKINKLLDVREELFNQLRKLKPAIKNPF